MIFKSHLKIRQKLIRSPNIIIKLGKRKDVFEKVLRHFESYFLTGILKKYLQCQDVPLKRVFVFHQVLFDTVHILVVQKYLHYLKNYNYFIRNF